MTEDEKIFLEFMDYLAFEEYQEEQKKAESFNGLYNYDDTDLLTDHHYSAPVKTTLPKQNAHNTPPYPSRTNVFIWHTFNSYNYIQRIWCLPDHRGFGFYNLLEAYLQTIRLTKPPKTY